jgi:hypothetical protein
LARSGQPLAGHDGGDAGRIDHEGVVAMRPGDRRRSANSRRRCGTDSARQSRGDIAMLGQVLGQELPGLQRC